MIEEVYKQVDVKEAIKIVDDLVLNRRGWRLEEPEIIVLEAAWSDVEYQEVAEKVNYDINVLQRRVAPKLWVLLTGILGNGEEVTKKRLRAILERRMALPNPQVLSSSSDTQLRPNTLQILGGEPPDVSSFYGRVPELALLQESIKEERCLVLVGPAGIGKSALVAKLIEIVPQSLFDCFIWKSLHYKPSLQALANDLLKLLAPRSKAEELGWPPEDTQDKVSALIENLRDRRCLLVLDAAEAVLQGNSKFNTYGSEYAEYGVFFRRIIESKHQSCLVLTSREPFADIRALQDKGQPARSVKIEGLGKEAMQILRAKGLTEEDEWGSLISTYRGNPLALKLVASRIQEFFDGSVKEYLSQTIWISDPFEETLDEQFGETSRLSDLERQILVYLAEELAEQHESIKLGQLLSNPKIKGKAKISMSNLIDSIKSLEERSLIEKSKNAASEVVLSIQPVIRKYILTDPSGLVRAFADANIKSA